MLTRALAGAAAAALLGLLPALLAAGPAAADDYQSQQQWIFSMLDVNPATAADKGAGVTVAVIDSGVDPGISDLSGSVVTGPDYTGLATTPASPDWGQHGTWMASIIAAHGHDNGYDGVLGVAPAARILSIRVIPDTSDPAYKKYDAEPEPRIQLELAKGIRYAVDHHAQVISMSIGYSAPSGVVRAAVQYAYHRGVVLVASSGNSGDNDARHAQGTRGGMAPVSFPAEYPGVIGVGAVTGQGQPTSFSSGNLSVLVAAPGKRVLAEGRGDGQYYTVAGTSPACALVAGVAALLESRYPGIAPALVRQALTSTARPAGPPGYDFLTGFGIVDAKKALAKAGQLTGTRPAPSPVAAAAHFGGGPAALPPAPVAPRGGGWLVVFAVGLGGSAALAGCGAVALAKRRRAG